MKYKFKKLYGTDIEVEIDGQTVLFEQAEVTDSVDDYSIMWWMNGYVGEKVVYEAIASYEIGSDNFIELTDIGIV